MVFVSDLTVYFSIFSNSILDNYFKCTKNWGSLYSWFIYFLHTMYFRTRYVTTIIL